VVKIDRHDQKPQFHPVLYKSHAKHETASCRHNITFLNVEASCMHGNHYALSDYKGTKADDVK
jgi:hypothetical protein